MQASTLQRESAELGGLVDRDLVLGLPVNGRSYEQLALLEPGVVATTSRETSVLYQHGLKININGASSRSNAFLLDGTSVTDLYNNGLGSVAGMFLGLEAVREFQVLTNAYDASHGGVSGGVVSIITKSGSSDLHGSAFAHVQGRSASTPKAISTVKSPNSGGVSSASRWADRSSTTEACSSQPASGFGSPGA